jgi:hypothetical protein
MHRLLTLLPRAATRVILGGALLSASALTAGVPLGGIGAAQAGDNMMDQMVRKFCLDAVNKDVADSGKPAPDGMSAFTCDCVVQQMKLKQSIDGAKAICKAKAAEKYSL